MKNLGISKLSPETPLRVPESLSFAATFTALDSWTQLVKEIYGYETYRFEAMRNNEVTGILALTHVHHPIFGNYLATSPFGSFGGFAFSSAEARDSLLNEAQKLADELKVEYAVVRFIEENNAPPSSWIQNPIYSTYLIDLPPNPEDLMQTFGRQHRKHTRQSLRSSKLHSVISNCWMIPTKPSRGYARTRLAVSPEEIFADDGIPARRKP
ncbi:MAG: hypothetical protein U0X87_17270 [Anaerolineales bacterium]